MRKNPASSLNESTHTEDRKAGSTEAKLTQIAPDLTDSLWGDIVNSLRPS